MTPRLADVLPEPPDGSVLVLVSNGVYEVIKRDDSWATGVFADERWRDLGSPYDDTLAWGEITRYASQAFALGELLASTEEPAEEGR